MEELEGRTVQGIEYDSRRVQKGFVFVAFQGAHADGNHFAGDALARGAILVMSEMTRPSGFSGPWLQVEHARKALATAARNFYGAPDEHISFTGITGTNG